MSKKVVRFAQVAPISHDFLMDMSSPVAALGGPLGTGKTATLMLKLLLAAMSIAPDAEGVRKSRMLVARKRYGDLAASVIRTLSDVIAPGVFTMTGQRSPMLGNIRFPYTAPDGTGKSVDCEILFYAFETADDAEKIRSINLTNAYIAEAQELVSTDILSLIYSRLGRYPTADNVDDAESHERNTAITFTLPNGATHHTPQLSLDFNFPAVAHHFTKYMVGENPRQPDGTLLRKLYAQPPIYEFIPGATIAAGGEGVEGQYRGEHGMFVRNLGAAQYIKFSGWAYYEGLLREMSGDDALIQQSIFGEWGTSSYGKPVYPRFKREVHVAKKPLKFLPGIPVVVGVDQGINNAWIYMQQLSSGTIYIVAEIVNVGEEAKPLRDAVEQDVIPYMNQELHGHMVRHIIDQASLQREGGEGKAQIEILSSHGLRVKPCSLKRTTPMRELVNKALSMQQLIVSPTCTYIIDGFLGGFAYKPNKQGIYSDEPDQRSEYSHPLNALEFGVAELLYKAKKPQSTTPKRKKEYSYL